MPPPGAYSSEVVRVVIRDHVRLSVHASISQFSTFISPECVNMFQWNSPQLLNTRYRWHFQGHWVKGQGQPAMAIEIL